MLGAVGPIPAPQHGGEERSRGDAGGSPGGAGGTGGRRRAGHPIDTQPSI